MVQSYRALKEAGVTQEMAFSREEYDARLAKVRKAMAEQDIDVLLVHHTPNFCYLAGYQSPLANWYGCLILPREGEPIAQMVELEISNLMVHGWDNENIYVFEWHKQGGAPRQLVDILKERGYGDKRLGLEFRLPGCSALTLRALQEGLPQAQIKDASDLVLHFRAVKSPAEMAHIREAARITDIGMEAALAEVAPGKTDNDLTAASYDAMVRAGSEYQSVQPLTYVAQASGMIHVVAKRRTMNVGDAVIIELTGVYHRYGAPVERTAIIGQPSDIIKRMSEYVLTAHALLYETARPGRAASDVAKAVTRGLRDFKLPPEAVARAVFFGYSVGIAFPPDWVEQSMFVDVDTDRLLEEGMVFHAPLSARVPGKSRVSISECWTVTPTGSEPLSKLPRDLIVVPA